MATPLQLILVAPLPVAVGSGSGSSSNSGGFPSRFTGVAAHIKDLAHIDCFLNQHVLELLHTETLRYLEQYLEDKEYLDEHPNARVA